MPDETMVVTAPPGEGNVDETAPQGTEPGAQAPAQTQEPGQTQVGSPGHQPQAPASGRPPASQFYGDRKVVRRLEQSLTAAITKIEQLEKRLQTPSPSPGDANGSKLTDAERDRFYNDPYAFLSERENKLLETISRQLDEKAPVLFGQIERQKEIARKTQEAMELLFPKDSKNPNESLENRVSGNPERAERIKGIFDSFKLAKIEEEDPLLAAQIATDIFERRYGTQAQKIDPSIPKKGQMSSTATGTPPGGGGQRRMTVDEIKSKTAELDKRLESNPALRYDDKWKTERDALKAELSKRVQELSAK